MRTNGEASVVPAGRHRLRQALMGALLIVAAAGVVVLVGGVREPAARVERPDGLCMAFGSGPVNNGKAVIAAGLMLHIPEEGIVVGLAAAMQDTGLRNLANPNVAASMHAAHDGLASDHQSVGILGQTPWWGPAGELMSPVMAAEKFFTSMRGVDRWEAMAPAQVAGIVQASAWPDAYVDDVAGARRFYRDYVAEVQAAGCPNAAASTYSALVEANR